MISKVFINNDKITVVDPTPQMISWANQNLSYIDKSKQYQLRRMAKSLWHRNSPAFAKLQKEVNGSLFSIDENILTMSTGFLNMFLDIFSDKASIQDDRKETGHKISLPWSKKPYDLRPYQREAVDTMLANSRGVINFATGLGKTLLATHMIQQYKKRTLVVCPSESVAKQFYTLFESCFGKNKVGFYGSGKKKINDITVGIAASICKGINDFKAADLGLMIIDETHHTPANTFFDIADGLASIGKIFGLTATDYRSDGKDIMITAGCGSVIMRRDIRWGVENGWLAEPYFIVRKVPTGGKDFKDDKLKSYKEHVLNNNIMKSRIKEDAEKMMESGKSVLILVDEVAHGEELSKQLDIPFATGIDSKSQDYVDALNKGKVRGLVGTDGRIGEGTDTQNVDVLILANFVASKGPVIQAIGRGLRKQGQKTRCIVLDYIPMGSSMLSRHANNRISYYREITDKVKIV
jgi:superfamily II DNA or RNA helicase